MAGVFLLTYITVLETALPIFLIVKTVLYCFRSKKLYALAVEGGLSEQKAAKGWYPFAWRHLLFELAGMGPWGYWIQFLLGGGEFLSGAVLAVRLIAGKGIGLYIFLLLCFMLLRRFLLFVMMRRMFMLRQKERATETAALVNLFSVFRNISLLLL